VNEATGFELEVFYDGDCPLCMREVRWLRRRDRRQRIRFVDIAAPGFDAREAGVPLETLMERIHGRLPDGTVIDGVEVFRRIYAAVGFPTLARLSRLPESPASGPGLPLVREEPAAANRPVPGREL
jgi:predicted DCC family thiol-disulfide oxidoreductase YuxK